MTQYEIYWRGPFTYHEVVGKEGYDSSEKIYAIIDGKPPFDSESICLGRTVNQTIAEALQNGDCGIEDAGNESLRYYLAKIIPKRKRKSIGFSIRHKGKVPPLVRTLTIP